MGLTTCFRQPQVCPPEVTGGSSFSNREIETRRLCLRMFAPDDLDDLARLFADPDVVKYMGQSGEPFFSKTVHNRGKATPLWTTLDMNTFKGVCPKYQSVRSSEMTNGFGMPSNLITRRAISANGNSNKRRKR
ncbi:MAG: GNAT family N-acetyltransferase [Pyrinomonadaceae bacterium]